MESSRPRIYALLLLMTLLWGSNYVAAKIALKHFPPFLFSPLRVQVGAVVFALLWWWQSRHRPEWASPIEWREVPLLAGLGLLGVGINQLLFLLGMQRTSTGHGALVFSTMPLLVLLIASWRGHEPLSARKMIGMGTAIAGIAVLNIAPAASARVATPLGDLITWIAALCFAVFSVFSKEAIQKHGGLSMSSLSHISSGTLMLPFTLYYLPRFDFAAVPFEGWATFFFMTLLAGVGCFLILYYAWDHLPASEVAAFTYLQPLIAAATGYLMLGEPVTLPLVLGGALVLSGVWTAQRA